MLPWRKHVDNSYLTMILPLKIKNSSIYFGCSTKILQVSPVLLFKTCYFPLYCSFILPYHAMSQLFKSCHPQNNCMMDGSSFALSLTCHTMQYHVILSPTMSCIVSHVIVVSFQVMSCSILPLLLLSWVCITNLTYLTFVRFGRSACRLSKSCEKKQKGLETLGDFARSLAINNHDHD